MRFPIYGWTVLAGVLLTLLIWVRLARRDSNLALVYVGALVGAFSGAKVAYLVCEGWIHWGHHDQWSQWATGKTILGALLGGYLGVETTKFLLGIRRVTGDWFALVAPLGIIVGRIGCLHQGCCPGRVFSEPWIIFGATLTRWPAVPIEMIFNALFLIVCLVLRRRSILPGQHFHLYLISYGLFRFAHEFARETPRVLGNVSGYQVLALIVTGWGIWAFERRRRHPQAPPEAQRFRAEPARRDFLPP